jgi:hypothetical protein
VWLWKWTQSAPKSSQLLNTRKKKESKKKKGKLSSLEPQLLNHNFCFVKMCVFYIQFVQCKECIN